jgi:site-specific DNA-methyltransferase (adenine-specific)
MLELDEKSIELAENIDRKDFDWKEKVRLEQKIHELQIALHGEKHSTSPDASGWSMRDTATLLMRSPAAVSRDIGLAKALETIPGLAECKTKDDAQKMLRNVQEGVLKAELAKRVSAEIEQKKDLRRQNLINAYVVGDTFDGLAKIPSNTIQFIDCDPPYGINLDNRARGLTAQRGTFNPDDYHEVRQKDYLTFLETLAAELYRVMTPNSWMTFWFGIDPWAEPVYQILTKAGFKLNRVFAVWYKTRPPYHSSQPHTNLASAYDAFYYCRKGDAVLFKQGQGNVFNYPQVTKKVHPTEKAVDLMQAIISLFTLPGNQILVPFLGSGNTMLAAANLNCPASGFDLSENYKNDFSLKVFAQPFGQYTSYGG